MSTTETQPANPVLFCLDGSESSRDALAIAVDLLAPSTAVVLTVWETVAMRLTAGGLAAGAGMSYVSNEGELDERERVTAQDTADQGMRDSVARGWQASARVEQAQVVVWQTIVEVADEIDASLIVCGARGLNAVQRAVIGSVSDAVLHHSHRPVLVSPLPRH